MLLLKHTHSTYELCEVIMEGSTTVVGELF